ncbi:MAG: hypothetical protein LH660_12455 [Phormidesmis sp. CAN_BIN36]|nr:hypothetical protein [Phormidesmis sp. CAN_BIN36]
MARKKITDLLGLELTNLQSSIEPEVLNSLDNVSQVSEQHEKKYAELQSPKLPELQSLEVPELLVLERQESKTVQQERGNLPPIAKKYTELQSLRVSDKQSFGQTESVDLEVPKYLQLERKEVRLRLDQLDILTALIRRLNRTRKGKGERLTENTLIRVAIDLLVENADRLQGTTEDELLASLGLLSKDK